MDIDVGRPGVVSPSSAGVHTQTAEYRGSALLAILRQNGWLIFGCACLGMVAIALFARSLPKSYTAESDIAVAGERFALAQVQGVLTNDSTADPLPQVRTEVQALEAQQLLIGLVNELHLDRDPEFNASLRPPTLLGEVIGAIKELWPSPAVPKRPEATRDSIVNAVSHALFLRQDNKSLVIGVTFTAQDPQIAAAAVNRLVADYMTEIAKHRLNADTGANTAMTQRIEQVSAEIKDLEEKEKQLRSSSGMVALRAGSVGQQQLENLAVDESQLAVQASEIQSNLARASAAAASGSIDELATVLNSPTISRLRDQETEAAGKVADIEAQFGPNYPDLQSARAHLTAVRALLRIEANRIVASLASQLKATQAHEADVKGQLAEARKAGAASQDVLAELAQLDQDILTKRNLYGTLLQAAQQTMTQPSSDSLPDVRVLSFASVPGLPSFPNMKLAAGLGGVAGALIGGVIAMIRPSGNIRFKDESELARLTGLNILSVLPGGWRSDRLVVPGVVNGPYAGALRKALTLIRSAGNGNPPRIVGLVGAQSGRQAASIAAALAHVATYDGKSVLLIEAGGERGNFAKLLPARHDPIGRAVGPLVSWRDELIQDSSSSISLLLDHPHAEDSTYRTVELENLLVEVKEEFDLVLVGAPEAGDAGAIDLARSCDLTVLVVDLGMASSETTRASAATLASVSRSRLGAIVLGTA